MFSPEPRRRMKGKDKWLKRNSPVAPEYYLAISIPSLNGLNSLTMNINKNAKFVKNIGTLSRKKSGI
jgi:hypothetical protein